MRVDRAVAVAVVDMDIISADRAPAGGGDSTATGGADICPIRQGNIGGAAMDSTVWIIVGGGYPARGGPDKLCVWRELIIVVVNGVGGGSGGFSSVSLSEASSCEASSC